MKFKFYTDALEPVPKLSLDGTVPNSIHFSHWKGNQTPAEVKADTSTEIALNLVASPNANELTKGLELVTNNHFDTDGVLSVWTVLTGKHALNFRELLVAAAEAGDFSEYTSEAGMRINLAIQGSDGVNLEEKPGSPLARLLAGGDVEDARAYELILPEVEHLLTNIDDYEPLWHDGWKRISDAVESFTTGRSKVKEISAAKLSVITLAPDIFSSRGFNPTRHVAPFTAISRFAHSELYLIAVPANGNWFYRIDYPYHSWAETVVRQRIPHRDFTSVLTVLNQRETSGVGRWKTDNRELTSAVKFLDEGGTLAPSALEPDYVANVLGLANSQETI